MAGDDIFDSGLTTQALILSQLGGDSKQNKHPVYEASYELDASEWNNVTKGLAQVAKRVRYGNLVCYSFFTASAAATASNTALQAAGSDSAIVRATAWQAGSVVGLAAWCENTVTGGTCTIKWTLGGTAQTLTAVLSTTNSKTVRAYQLPGEETFAAGDQIGAQITTAGFTAGSTPSVRVDVIVSYGGEENI